ncbi:MAG: LPS-assembly protein LptD [Rhodospirillales bacterium]|nr:LPS-assembly protein LptD [Rhodospirillales bacterium]
MPTRLFIVALILLTIVGIGAGTAKAAGASPALDPDQRDLPILFTADEVSHDRALSIVRASGNVEISHADRVLLADAVTYNQNLDLVTATGNIALLESSGEVLFAEHMEITGDLKSGVIEDFRALLADGSRLAAAGGRRQDGNLTEMRKGVYSPCNLCAEDPRAAPLWQVKAVSIVHDQEAKEITYSDAWLEFAGLPIAYTPYLSHPDPSVKRKSGVLVPTFGDDSLLGLIVQAPYFWVIDDTKDATITPIITTKEGPALALEYRQRLKKGELQMSGSGAHDSSEFLGHVFSEFRYDINDTWRGGVDFDRTTDDTYLRRYGFGNERTLTSRGFVEGFRGRNYLTGGAYAFQSLEDGVDDAEIPLVLPIVDYNHVGTADRFGGRPTFDANLAVLTREDGTDTRRLSTRAGYEVPFRDPIGGVYTLSAGLWGDGYHVSDQEIEGEPGAFSGVTGRVWPQAALEWRMPFVRADKAFDQVIEPVVQFVVSPIGGNPEEIPNEDSLDVELAENNVISTDRFPGLDRVEGGARINYGLGWDLFRLADGSASAFVGQSYRFHADSSPEPASGLDGNLSDLVGTVDLTFLPWFDMQYRTRVDQSEWTFARNELGFGGGLKALYLSGTYVYFADEAGDEFQGREELTMTARSQLTRFWRGRIFGTRDLAENQQLRYGIGLTYEDECFLFDTRLLREEFRDRDLEPRDSLFFRIALKTIGDLGFGL